MAGVEILQQEDCRQVVDKLVNSSDFQITHFKIRPFRHQMQGLVGEHFSLLIEYTHQHKAKSQEFFVKTLSTNRVMNKLTKALLVYEKEVFYYNLLDEFAGCKIDTSFAPRGYFFKPFLTVLEDVSLEGYKGTPKRKLLDLDHCRSCLTAIAQFHAAAILYEKRKSTETGRKFSLRDQNEDILEDKFATKQVTPATKWLQAAIEGIFYLIELVPENNVSSDALKMKLLELLGVDSGSDGLIFSTLHGDLWTSNFLHLYENDKPVKSKLFDFQLLKYGPVESDVAEFLMTNTSRELRDKHFEVLTEHYYKSLSECLKEYPEVLPSCAEFVSSCNNFKIAGKLHAAVDHTYTFESDEVFAAAMKSEDEFSKFLFDDRGKYVVEAYKRNEEFRKMVIEDVLELRDLLFCS